MQGAPAFVRTLGRVARSLGQTLDRVGAGLQEHAYVERLVPSTRVVAFKGAEMKYGLENFVASSASVVGDVTLGELSSVWYGATVRGDRGAVTVGRNSAIMDNAVVVAAKGKPVSLGADVVVAPGAVVRGASVGDGAMIGMGAQVQPGARIGNDSFVDAGAVVTARTVIPPGQLWTGAPARMLRALSADEMSQLRSTAGVYGDLGQTHFGQDSKSVAEVEYDTEIRLLKLEGGYAPNAPIVQPDADVVQYYKLTAAGENHGLFRSKEYDREKEFAEREAEELAADRAEEAYFNQIARAKRVGEAMRLLSGTKPALAAAREKVVADLEARDPEGAAMLKSLLLRVAAASAPGASAADKEEVLRTIGYLEPTATDSQAEAQALAAATFDALAKHAVALGPALAAAGVTLPGAGSAGAGAAAQ